MPLQNSGVFGAPVMLIHRLDDKIIGKHQSDGAGNHDVLYFIHHCPLMDTPLKMISINSG